MPAETARAEHGGDTLVIPIYKMDRRTSVSLSTYPNLISLSECSLVPHHLYKTNKTFQV